MSKNTKNTKNTKIKEPTPLFKKIEDFINMMRYIADIDYNQTECVGCEDYCRCREITSTSMNIKRDAVAKRIVDLSSNKIDIYCIDRIFNSLDFYNEDSWEIQIENGYYGQEIGSVSFKEYNSLMNYIKKIEDTQDDFEKIKIVLELEYGYLLEIFKSFKTAKIINIDLSKISFPNDSYVKKVKNLDHYKKSYCPIGVVKEITPSKDYKIIDGHHRTIAAIAQNKTSEDFILLS